MNEILELQTGQVSFISGLMAGFALSIAVQVFRSNVKNYLATTVYVLLTTSSLLFLVGLYIDVALSLKTAGTEEFSDNVLSRVSEIREIGTSAATIALFLFIGSIGMLGYLQSKIAGVITTILAFVSLIVLWMARIMIFGLNVTGWTQELFNPAQTTNSD